MAFHTAAPQPATMSRSGTDEKNAMGHPKLVPKNPVPSDIAVSQDIVKEVGLLPIAEVARE